MAWSMIIKVHGMVHDKVQGMDHDKVHGMVLDMAHGRGHDHDMVPPHFWTND